MFKFNPFKFKKQEIALTAATILIPLTIYLVIAIFVEPEPTWEVVTIAVLGTIYLLVSLTLEIEGVFKSNVGKFSFFVVMCGLGLTINFIAPPGYMWIILAPLIGVAESTLKTAGRWVIYAVVLIGSGGPYITNYGWDSFFTIILYIPAVLFVVTFTRLTMRAEKDKQKAESLTKELEEANRKLGEYAIQAEEMATTQERNRIAREIHDNLGHYLTVINVQLEAAKVTFDLKPEKSRDAINKAQNLTKEGLGAIRDSIASLRENPVANRPIPDAIAELILENEQAGITTEFEVTAEPRSLPPNTTLTLYRIVQEALTNVRKHAQASEVSVLLDYNEPETVHLKISDNGIGSAGTGSGFGLMGITERVTSLGGTLDIDTSPEAGFELAISIPG